MVGDLPLPVLVKVVLLPYKGRIIYDGVFMPYSMTFGPGIRGDLNEIYQRAKQNDAIVETLELETAPKPQKPTRDWRPLLDEVVQQKEQLRQADNVVQSRAFSLLNASARLARAAAHTCPEPHVRGDPEQLENLDQLARRTVTALRQLETALDRAQAA